MAYKKDFSKLPFLAEQNSRKSFTHKTKAAIVKSSTNSVLRQSTAQTVSVRNYDPSRSSVSTALSEYFQSFEGLVKLQQRLNILLKKRIKLLVSADKSPQTRQAIKVIDYKLQAIRKRVLQMNKENAIECSDEWKPLNQKLKLIEQLMSCSITDVQILKNFYQIFTHNTEYERLGWKAQVPSEVKQNDLRNILFQKARQARVYTKKTVNFSTTNQNDFVRPATNYYTRPYHSQSAPAKNDELPFPKSTYNQCFPAYKSTKVYKHVPSDDIVKTVENFYSGVSSSYQSSYKEHAGTSKMKDLNTFYKDNIKNLQLVYRIQKAKASEDMTKVVPLIERQANIRPLEKPVQIMAFSGQFDTECNKNYKLYIRNESDISIPKEKRLKNLVCMNRSQFNQNIV